MTISRSFTVTAQCPGCKNEIYFYRTPKLGEFVTCPECEDLVEVVKIDPLTLDWSADIEDEEWPDYWDDYDEESTDIGDYASYED